MEERWKEKGVTEEGDSREVRVPVQLYDRSVGLVELLNGSVKTAGMKTISAPQTFLPHITSLLASPVPLCLSPASGPPRLWQWYGFH